MIWGILIIVVVTFNSIIIVCYLDSIERKINARLNDIERTVKFT